MTTEPNYPGEFILSEAPRERSRDQATFAPSTTFLSGTVLGKITVGTLSVAAAKTGAGTGAITGATVAAGSTLGAYVATAISATAFEFQSPTGIELGTITVGTAFTLGGITATIAAGGTAWSVGDTVTYTVTAAAGSGYVVPLAPAATDGSQNVFGIAFAALTTGAAAVQGAIIADAAEVKSGMLDWGSLNAGQIAAAILQLNAKGIKVR